MSGQKKDWNFSIRMGKPVSRIITITSNIMYRIETNMALSIVEEVEDKVRSMNTRSLPNLPWIHCLQAKGDQIYSS